MNYSVVSSTVFRLRGQCMSVADESLPAWACPAFVDT